MKTKPHDGEKVLLSSHDKSAWLTRKMNLTSERSGISAERSSGLHHGSIFLTNLRIIFESLDGNTVEIHFHDKIKSVSGENVVMVTFGELAICPYFGPTVKYRCFNGKEIADKANKEFDYYTQFVQNQEKMEKEDKIKEIETQTQKAQEREEHLDYDAAIVIYEGIGKHEDAARLRKLKAEQGAVKVDQTVIHGDYVDDRDTIVKDSVISKSNIGAGGKSKAEEIKEIKELLDSGAIDKDDYEKMKREIIG